MLTCYFQFASVNAWCYDLLGEVNSPFCCVWEKYETEYNMSNLDKYVFHNNQSPYPTNTLEIWSQWNYACKVIDVHKCLYGGARVLIKK